MKILCVMVILVTLWTGIKGQECTSFQFTEEPPATLDCNPFNVQGATPIWQLKTSCTVMRINDTLGAFEVRWFHNDTQGNVVDKGQPDFYDSIDNRKRASFGDHLSNMDFTQDMLGEYWCQVVTSSDNAHYGRGNTVVVLHPDQYATEVPVCSETISVSSNSCADSFSYPIKPSSSQYVTGMNSTANTPTTTSVSEYTTIATTSSVSYSSHQGMGSISSLFNTQSNVVQQSITYKGNVTSSEPLSIKAIAGIVFSALALVAVVILVGCLIFMLANPEKRKKSQLVRRLSKRHVGYLMDMSMMGNPLYIKFKIKKHNETDQGNQTIVTNGGQDKYTTSQNTVRATVATDTRRATIAVKDHQYANVGIVPTSKIRRASEGNKETGAFPHGYLKHHYYTNVDTSSGSLASLASVSTLQLTSSPRYENVSLPRDTPDHTYSNQEEMGGVRGERRSHDYVNVTLTPAASLEELA